MDGGDSAGYMQNSDAVDSVLITTTMGVCSASEAWYKLKVLSSEALFIGITAPGLKNAALISSGTTFQQGAEIACSKITIVELSTDLPEGQIIVHTRIVH